ncbi:alpha/beta hydrolase [Chitinimonas naiadis]
MKWLSLPLLYLLTACAATDVAPGMPRGESSFAVYREQSRAWLQQHRQFLTADKALEVELNAPQEWRPTVPAGKGVLLVHGLGDSPFSFSDIGPRLAERGFLVRTLLLPGHGTRPADMIGVSADDWRGLVERQTRQMEQEVGEVYLGGFSTGANLVTSVALEDGNVAGLMLFSPAFKAGTGYDWLSPWIAPFKSWLRTPEEGRPQQTLVRYLNVPTNGFAQFYHTSSTVRSLLARKTFDKPALLVMTEHDSVLDVQQAASLFNTRFTHAASRLVWYGKAPTIADPRIVVRDDYLPQQRISQFSHMGILFSPANRYYGPGGMLRFCQNGQTDEATRRCQSGEEVWYSDWGFREPGKVHARLTFNPYFDWQIGMLAQVLGLPG